jgi:hypothetical protein
VYFGLINRGHEAAALVVHNQIPYALPNSGLDGTRILRDLMKKDGKHVAFIDNFQKNISQREVISCSLGTVLLYPEPVV